MSRTGSAGVDYHGLLAVAASFDGPLCVVEMSGVLDLASCDAAIRACTWSDQIDVVVDLSGLAFMDCAGYGALVASTTILEGRGGSLVVLNPDGEVQMLLALIDDLELGPVRSDLRRFARERFCARARCPEPHCDARSGRTCVSVVH